MKETFMRTLLLLTFIMSLQTFAMAPECPQYANKYDCLKSAEDNFEQLLDFIKEEYKEESKIQLIEAANDVKRYEKLACQKTCLN